MDLGSIIIGWILGLMSSYTVHWSERNLKISDFLNGCYAQMCELQPRLVSTYLSVRGNISPLSKDDVKWVSSFLSGNHDFRINGKMQSIVKLMVQVPEQEFSTATETIFLSKTAVPTGKGLKKFNLSFLETNLSTIALLNSQIQVPIWKILDRINLLNQEIDNYLFYLRRTFEPQVMETNEAILQNNMKLSLQFICINIKDTTDVISDLMNNLKAEKDKWAYKRLSLFKKKSTSKRTTEETVIQGQDIG
jgi:hypothetical protein